MKSTLDKTLGALLAVILPFILLMGAVRLIMTLHPLRWSTGGQAFWRICLALPKRSASKWSAYAVNYLVNDAET